MPKLSAIQVAERQRQVLEVYRQQRLNPDLKINELCELVGIEERTFYMWVRKSGNMIDALTEMVVENQKEELYIIESERLRMTRDLIEKYYHPLTTGPEKVRILEFLGKRSDELQDAHHAKPGIEQDAFQYLQGPQLSLQKSRLASIEVREDATEGVTIDIYKDKPIIDLED